MRRTIREQVAAMRDEAEALGGRIVHHDHGGRHPYAVLAYRGKRRRLVFSGSPRSGADHVADWGRQAVRRAVREIRNG